MIIKASGRAALILTTGIWICLGAPSQAAAAPEPSAAPAAVKHHHLKKIAHHKPDKVADKAAGNTKTVGAATVDSDTSAAVQPEIPDSVANAHAQLVSADTPAGSAQAMTDRANTIVQTSAAHPADAQAAAAPVVASDQLNDVDRALQQGTPTAVPVAMASAETPAAAPNPTVVASGGSSESSTWDKTSLIGKVFIGFGALLTMASAARMFMA